MKILIMGLPGSGKTTLAAKLKKKLNAEWINADDVRKENNDWDFSDEGVLRQSKSMGILAEKFKNNYVSEKSKVFIVAEISGNHSGKIQNVLKF